MPELNICDQTERLTDEYFHEELSPEDKKILENHIKSCEKCAIFFENEKIYFSNIKSAEFSPEINIAESVMNIIISEQRTADKPVKKRFVPFGLISAAAIVLVIFIASRDTLYLFKNTVNDSTGNIKIEEEHIEDLLLDDDSAENNIGEFGGEAEVFAIPQIRAMFETGETDEQAKESADMIVPAEEESVPTPISMSAVSMPTPGEIIKIRRGDKEDFNFTEYIFIGESIFITKEYKSVLIEDLKKYGIDFETENTGIESEYIEIIYID